MKLTALLLCTVVAICLLSISSKAQVLLNEIHYHPVERPVFDTNGLPVLDISDDVHEFVELINTNASSVSLQGWRLSGAISFEFPSGAQIAAGGFVVVAKSPARLAMIPSYAFDTNSLFGPYDGQLGNSGDTLRLRNAADEVIDATSYSATAPWPISANALGADDEWTGLRAADFQYRGRSLERVSVFQSGNDPANWLASSLVNGPTPGRPNTVVLAVPRPIVLQFSAVQQSDGQLLIRSNQPVRLEVVFSGTNSLSNVAVDFFVEDINQTNEARVTLAMVPVGAPVEGRFAATLPGQSDRAVVRYRVRANRGVGMEVVLPRADDPFGWYSYFVTPTRSSVNPIYDVFISTASLSRLSANISQSPRRVTLPDPPGLPRDSWNATEPAIFVHNGVVYDIQMRHHGSRYNRSAGRKSYKFQFPDYAPFNGRTSYFETDKGEEHRLGSKIYDAVELPMWRTRYVDVYLNGDAMDPALEQEEIDSDLYRRWITEQHDKNPDAPRESMGETYKATGVVPYETATGQGTAVIYENTGEGPYYTGNSAPIPAKQGWSINDRYAWTYGLQVKPWKGGVALRQLIDGLWAARGDSPTAPNPNLPAVRVFLSSNFDVDATLTYIAIRNWSGPFDDVTHNHFLWQRGDGKWGMLPWDLDAEFSGSSAAKSIYWDEAVVPQPDALRGPNWTKDSFLKAFREEYRQKLFVLNNTLLSPAGLSAIGASGLSSFAASRQPNVNTQLGLGPWYAPARPTNLSPANAAIVFPPAILRSSPYLHTSPSNPPPAHARTSWVIRRGSSGFSNVVYRSTSTTNLTTLSIPFNRLDFGETYYWKAVYWDVDGHPSPESGETSFIFGGPPSVGAVVLSELLADNPGTVLNGGYAPDYLEVANTTALPQDLSAMSLSDDPGFPGKYPLPAGTVIPPLSRLVIWCDDATNSPGLHSRFRLDKDGQTVLLFTSTNGQYALSDIVTYGLQIPGKSIGRIAGTWVLNDPTPGADNMAAAIGQPGSLRINEWMASSTSGPDWLEIYNSDAAPVALGGHYLSDSSAQPTNTRIASLSFIAPHGYQKFLADQDLGQGPHHVNFHLSAGGDQIVLTASNLVTIDAITFGPQATDVSQGRLPDGSGSVAAFVGSASPEAANYLPISQVEFNELLPDVELRNLGASAVALGGWWLSDDPLVTQKYQIPAGTTIPAGGVWTVSEASLPFVLDRVRGGTIVLSHDGTHRISARYGPSDGHSYGTVPTSIGVDFVRLNAPSFGSVNGPPVVGPVVISEIQYHPPDLPGDDDDYEFIELSNITSNPVNLFLTGSPNIPWRLRDAVSFTFPAGTTLAGGERVLVVGFDPVTNLVVRSNFLSAAAVPVGTRLFGPYFGKLSNSDASVELVAPQLPISVPGPDYQTRPEILLERVHYADSFPWPIAADGTGASLQRRFVSSYGNDPTNWLASGVSPGSATATNAYPTVAILAPNAGAILPFNLPITLSASAEDSDGVIRRVEFRVDGSRLADASTPPFSVIWSNASVGTHTLVARAYDDRLGITQSGPVTFSVSNALPTVSLVSPTNGADILLPTELLLEAMAGDPDGSIVRVEFFANGFQVGVATQPPYRFLWINPNSGGYTVTAKAIDNAGASTTSAGVNVAVAHELTIAYAVDTNTVGTQSLPNPYALGMDFNVLQPILVTQLGCFDSSSDGINASSSLTTQIFNRNGVTPVVVAGTNFSAADPGVLVGGSRFKPLAAPVILTNGSYSIVGYGYDGNNRNGNLGTGNAKSWSTDTGGGRVAFVGAGRYGAVAPGGFPATIDAGPADRYAAGTFQFRRVTSSPAILFDLPTVFVRPGASTNISVVAIGDAPLRYQWMFNGAMIPNATNASLQLANIQAANEGAYRVSVSNAFGVTLSSPANVVLLVNPGFVVRPSDQFVVSNGSFTVCVVITGAPPPFRFEWREQSAVRALTNSPALTNYFTFGPVTNLASRLWRIIVTNAATLSPGINATFNVTALADGDGDGLPDAWELQYGLNPANPADRFADLDGDGVSNLDEYLAGSDPSDPTNFLKILGISATNGAVITFGATSNRTYSVEYRDGFDSGWRRLADVVALSSNRVESVTDSSFTRSRFYRLTTPSSP